MAEADAAKMTPVNAPGRTVEEKETARETKRSEKSAFAYGGGFQAGSKASKRTEL